MVILALNAGSSSLKFGVFKAASNGIEQLMRGVFDGLGGAPHFSAKDAAGRVLADRQPGLPDSSAGTLLRDLLPRAR